MIIKDTNTFKKTGRGI